MKICELCAGTGRQAIAVKQALPDGTVKWSVTLTDKRCIQCNGLGVIYDGKTGMIRIDNMAL